jgi:hypothetical protein
MDQGNQCLVKFTLLRISFLDLFNREDKESISKTKGEFIKMVICSCLYTIEETL